MTPGFPLTQRGGLEKTSCHTVVDEQHPQSRTFDVLDYEYLPPTRENLRLLSIPQNRKVAKTKSLAAMPPKFKDRLYPCGRPSPLPAP